MGNIKDYIRIARIDHWIKQLFIFPGMVFAFFLVDGVSVIERLAGIILSFVATSFIASANYCINEWLDARFDKFHPTKKSRPVVSGNVKFAGVMIEYAIFTAAGLAAAWFVYFYLSNLTESQLYLQMTAFFENDIFLSSIF